MRNKNFVKLVTFICHIVDKTLRKVSLNDTLHYHKPSIYAFWHGNEFPMIMSNQKNSIVIMVSMSNDGELMSQILQNFGYLSVRGSSSKGGERALIRLIKYARYGHTLAFAADGPRGPYHKLKAGVVYTAQKTDSPLFPISCSSKNKIVLRTWAKTIIPFPFSKIVQIYGKPVYINYSDNIKQKTAFVENKLNKLFEFTNKYYWKKNIFKYLEHHPFPKILILQPSRIGDIVFSLPTLVAIKKKYPHAKLSWFVDERCFEILEGNPYLDNIFVWDRKRASFKYYKKLMHNLREQKFDLSIDLHGLTKSAMFVSLAGARFKIASSSTNGMREFSQMFSKEIKSPKIYHCVERHFEVAKYLSCIYKINYPIAIPEESFENVREELSKEKVNFDKLVGVHPGGGWVSRRWGSYNFGCLAQRLKNELDADIALVGGEEGGVAEKGLNEEIILTAGVKIADMTGSFTLKELCAFLTICKVFVGNEAGPMHIATALSTQAVAILGPTSASRTGPYKGNTKIIQHKLSCQPCRNKNCKNSICMRDITVEEVFKEVKQKLVR